MEAERLAEYFKRIRPDADAELYAWVLENECSYQGFPLDVAAAVLIIESGLHQGATSHCGAIGLGQVMPFWMPYLEKLGIPVRSERDLYHPVTNLESSVFILSQYLRRARGDVFLALCYYNAGPSNWQAGRGYARKVMSRARNIKKILD